MEGVLGTFHDDIVLRVGGDSKITGEYRGHQQVLDFFGAIMELSGGSFRLDVHDILANDDHAVALVTITAGYEDRSIEGLPDAHVWHVRDNKLSALWDCPTDQVVMDEFFRP